VSDDGAQQRRILRAISEFRRRGASPLAHELAGEVGLSVKEVRRRLREYERAGLVNLSSQRDDAHVILTPQGELRAKG